MNMSTPLKTFIGIDPGTTESGYCTIDENYKILGADKISNDELIASLKFVLQTYPGIEVAIESIQSYGMQMGKSTIETCYMIGRLQQVVLDNNGSVSLYPRPEYAKSICATNKINDSIIRNALENRFGSYDKGKKEVKLKNGTIKQAEVAPGPLFLLAGESDKRSAFAVVAYHLDKKRFSN